MISVVAIDMGYGHLRAGQPLADALSVPLQLLDHPPLGSEDDTRAWARARRVHEGLSRACQLPVIGRPFLSLMDGYTRIGPLHAGVDQARGTLATRGFAQLADGGLGARLVEHLRQGHRLLTTFYAPALIADRAGLPSHCLVTDADCHRIWVPDQPAGTRIHYFAPSRRVLRRLQAYGVPEERITQVGFPLPLELLGGPELSALKRNLGARLRRLDPQGRFRRRNEAELARELPGAQEADKNNQSTLIVFAVGGAGAQLPLAHQIMAALAPALREGRLRLALVAGVRAAVAQGFRDRARALGIDQGLEIVYQPTWPDYYRDFNRLLGRADVLWTKPSELTFYAALGLPLVLAPPVGAHERYNARWAQEHGAALPQLAPREAAGWLDDWLQDGTLADAAFAGFRRLDARGTFEIAAAVTNSTD